MHYFSEGDRGKFGPTSAQLTAKCGRPDKIKQTKHNKTIRQGATKLPFTPTAAARLLSRQRFTAGIKCLSVSRACTVRTLNVSNSAEAWLMILVIACNAQEEN